MSRLGKMPIAMPKGVEIKITAENVLVVKGAKGSLELKIKKGIKPETKDNELIIEIDPKEKLTSTDHGLYRALINNMVTGVSVGFKKKLLLVGVGYRSQVMGNKLVLQVGYSHPVEIEIPKSLKISVVKSVEITSALTSPSTMLQIST